MIVLQIQWRRDGSRDALFGRYVVDYDPTVEVDGTYTLTVTTELREARSFPTREAAEAYRDRPSPNAGVGPHWKYWGVRTPALLLPRQYHVAVMED